MFFLPGFADHEEAEAEYARLAASCGSTVPPIDDRIRSISFTHNSQRFVATVGQRRKGHKWHTVGGKRDTQRPPEEFEDGNVVVAIFEGDPVHYIFEEGQSRYNNPQWVGHSDTHVIAQFGNDENGS
jgi:hypothetical protein